jgi:ATP-dependent phosphofructokinase / diphosphate-dependent phosphofructokinase
VAGIPLAETTMARQRIGILTGGGDVPGLNTAIKAVALRARSHDLDLVGLRRGWLSLLAIDPDDPASVESWALALPPERVRTIDRTGGTILHTSRTNPGSMRAEDVPSFVRAQDRVVRPDGLIDCTRHALRVLDRLGLDALIAIGGDDTLSFASRLHQERFRVVAIPKTMDNDVFGTDYCIGFSTAVTRSVDAITNFRTSVGSHERIGVVELFGRNSGETSLFAAYLSDVDRALISEVPFDVDRLVRFLAEDRKRNPSNYALVTISEGAHPSGGAIHESGEEDAYGHRKLGGIGYVVSQEIRRRSGVNIMYEQLTYIMRSGAPDSLDRMVAVSFGSLACDQVALGHTGRMVSLQQGVYTTVPLDVVVAGKKRVDVAALYDSENYRPRVADMLAKPMFLY